MGNFRLLIEYPIIFVLNALNDPNDNNEPNDLNAPNDPNEYKRG